MTVAITAMLAVMLGCIVVITSLLAIVVSMLADLKAYVMTQISLLQKVVPTDEVIEDLHAS